MANGGDDGHGSRRRPCSLRCSWPAVAGRPPTRSPSRHRPVGRRRGATSCPPPRAPPAPCRRPRPRPCWRRSPPPPAGRHRSPPSLRAAVSPRSRACRTRSASPLEAATTRPTSTTPPGPGCPTRGTAPPGLIPRCTSRLRRRAHRPPRSCRPSAARAGPLCVIVDGTDHVSSGNGTDWSAPSVPDPGGPTAPADPADPGAGHPGSRHAVVSCPVPTFCAAVDNTGHVGRDGRRTLGVAPSRCRPVPRPLRSMWLGRSGSRARAPRPAWPSSGPTSSGGTAPPGPSSRRGPPRPAEPAGAAVSCPEVTSCWLVSGQAAVEWSSGRWSSPQTIDPGGNLDAVSCPTATFCVAADRSGSVAIWNGTAWSSPRHVLPASDRVHGRPHLAFLPRCRSSAWCSTATATTRPSPAAAPIGRAGPPDQTRPATTVINGSRPVPH